MSLLRKITAQPKNLAGILAHPMNRGRPLAGLGRWAAWQVGARLAGGERIIPFVNDLRIAGRVGMTGPATTAYWGLNEPDDMAFLCHALREGDVLADVGANIGLYGLLAAGVAGSKAVCFEPLPKLAPYLARNITLNGLEGHITHRAEAVGKAAGTIQLTGAVSDVSTRVLSAGDATGGAEVTMTTLDAALADTPPTCLKIDVEGYEGAVLEGAKTCLENPRLNAVLLEINTNAERYGYGADWILNRMTQAGFQPYRYHRSDRRLEALGGIDPRGDNTLFLRDAALTAQRVQAAPPIQVRGQSI